MEALLVNASASLQLRDRIRCVPIDSSDFLGRRLVTGQARVQSCRWSAGALRTRQGSVMEGAANQEDLDKQRAAMREWWMAQLAAKNGATKSTPKAPVDQKEMDKERAAMREWWMAQLAAKNGAATEAPVDQEEMDMQRAAMREWWMAQLAAKSGAAKSTTKAPVDQEEMDKQRAAMREWWMVQLAAKSGAAKSTPKAPVDQKEMDKQRAAMREWWLARQAEAQARQQLRASSDGAGPATAATKAADRAVSAQRAAVAAAWQMLLDAEAAVQRASAAAEAAAASALLAKSQGSPQAAKVLEAAQNAAKVVSSASQKVVAAKVEVSKSVEQETIEKELERERAKREGRQAEEKRVQQKVMDKARKEMREWWLAQLEAKKRALGLEPYEPCWLMVPDVGSIATESYELTGDGVIVGAVPQTSYDEKPVVIDVPVVSSNHAKVFGKDVIAGFGKYTREYFVRDLGSTNGTYLNKNRIRPKTDVKLRPGDTLRFADEKVTFIIKKGERS